MTIMLINLLPQYVQRLTFMRTDTTVQSRPVLAVHLGDASIKLGSFTYTPNEVNKALEMDGTYGVPLKEKFIRAFNKPGVTNTTIENQGPTSTRKRVVAVFLSSLPKDLALSIVNGEDLLCSNDYTSLSYNSQQLQSQKTRVGRILQAPLPHSRQPLMRGHKVRTSSNTPLNCTKTTAFHRTRGCDDDSSGATARHLCLTQGNH